MATDNNKPYYSDLFEGFKTEEELIKAKQAAPNSEEVLLKEGIYYFVTATGYTKGDKRARPMLEKCISIFDDLWKKNRSDDKNTIRLALAYSAICNTDIPLEDVMKNVFKSRNLYSMVVARSPQNMDARLGRTYININLPPETGRPDDVILEDVKVYSDGYNSLTSNEQERSDLRNGIMVMRLSAAIIWDYRNNRDLAGKYFEQITPEYLLAFKDMYKKLEKKYRR